MKLMRTKLNRTKKSRSNIETEATGKYQRMEIISRGNTKYCKTPTKTIGTNGPTTKIIGKNWTMDMGRRTTERLRKNKTNANRRSMPGTLCKRRR